MEIKISHRIFIDLNNEKLIDKWNTFETYLKSKDLIFDIEDIGDDYLTLITDDYLTLKEIIQEFINWRF